jgi:hypothetical protein
MRDCLTLLNDGGPKSWGASGVTHVVDYQQCLYNRNYGFRLTEFVLNVYPR